MPKSVFNDAYASVVEKLIALRKARGVSQVELAERLGKTQQFVSYLERAERRIDIIEFYLIAKALGADPDTLFAELIRDFPSELKI